MAHRFLATIAIATLFHVSTAQVLSDSVISSVTSRLAEGATHSWELGTRAQAILELYAPDYSVFSPKSLPPPKTVPSDTTSGIAPVFDIAKATVSGRGSTTAQPKSLVPSDGSSGDPASIGIAVLLANWTGQTDENYSNAAQAQLDYLLNVVPRTSDGAISHRAEEVQLWSDSVYMVPPFLAYYGMLTENKTLISEAYNQIKLYRNYLRDGGANNLWKHIELGSFNDSGHWSTGNGWAAAGMARVLATIQHSSLASSFQNEQSDLASWVNEIHAGMYGKLDKTNIFTNYPDESGSFYDASSTALLAASVYRISLLVSDHSHIPLAERCRKALSSTNKGGMVHFSSDGWLTPVVNPNSFGVAGSNSPESEAFVLEMHAAWKDWVADGSKGSGAIRTLPHWKTLCLAGALGLVSLIL
ncbi:glycoside hydrolase family 105 protein [Mycena floridula]|nr:glycoside hydrolase family 105 protein [Mycena floridula]